MHEFPISYSHTEWYFLFFFFGARETKHAQRAIGFVPEVAVQTIYLKLKFDKKKILSNTIYDVYFYEMYNLEYYIFPYLRAIGIYGEI